jgi:hypothetical protein
LYQPYIPEYVGAVWRARKKAGNTVEKELAAGVSRCFAAAGLLVVVVKGDLFAGGKTLIVDQSVRDEPGRGSAGIQ